MTRWTASPHDRRVSTSRAQAPRLRSTHSSPEWPRSSDGLGSRSRQRWQMRERTRRAVFRSDILHRMTRPEDTRAEASSSPRYVPQLDGLRAIAVLLVVLFHLGLGPFRSGFLGVDIFFVISGFLITSLLIAESKRTGRISLPALWARRARRLLPALALMLLADALGGR